MTKLRIAVYHNLHSGGAKRVVAEQLHRLQIRHDVTLFSLAGADHAFASHEDAMALPRVLLNFRPLPLAPSPFGRANPLIGAVDIARLDRLAKRTATLIDRRGVDVVLVHPCQVTQAPLVLRWLRTPSLYYCHELPRRLYEPPIARPVETRNWARRAARMVDPLPVVHALWLRSLDRKAARASTHLVTNSHYTRGNIESAYRRQAAVCYPGVDGSRFAPISATRERFVLSVGALTPAKGFDLIIRALGSLPPAERPRLVIVSNYQEPRELHFLHNLAQRCSVDVEFRARVTDEDLRSLYARAGCVVFAPVREPLGLVALEAMAAATPLVCVGEGGIPEIAIPDVSGMVTPREPRALARAIRRMLADPGWAQQLGATARRRALESWTWDRHIEQLERLLVESARGGPQRPGIPGRFSRSSGACRIDVRL